MTCIFLEIYKINNSNYICKVLCSYSKYTNLKKKDSYFPNKNDEVVLKVATIHVSLLFMIIYLNFVCLIPFHLDKMSLNLDFNDNFLSA